MIFQERMLNVHRGLVRVGGHPWTETSTSHQNRTPWARIPKCHSQQGSQAQDACTLRMDSVRSEIVGTAWVRMFEENSLPPHRRYFILRSNTYHNLSTSQDAFVKGGARAQSLRGRSLDFPLDQAATIAGGCIFSPCEYARPSTCVP